MPQGEPMTTRTAPEEDDDEIDLSKARIIGRGIHARRGVHLPLSSLRQGKGKTQAEMAKAIGTDQGEVSRMERRMDVKLSTLRRYARALGAKCEVVFVWPKTGHRIIVVDPEMPEK